MRTIEEIQTQIIEAKESEKELKDLNSTSKTSIWRMFIYIIAVTIHKLEKLWEDFKHEINIQISEGKIHSKDWYRQKALDFQYGFPVIEGTDKFDNTGKTEEEIKASKIIKQAACIKLINSSGQGILRVKVAKSSSNSVDSELAKLSDEELSALNNYYQKYAVDAGTYMKVTSSNPDDLFLTLDIYYDPLVLSSTGSRLDGSSDTPVKDEITKFLKSLNFNGALIISDLMQKLRNIEGVEIAVCKEARSKYGSYSYNQIQIPNVGLIDEIRIADAGYMKLDEQNLTINYKLI